MGSAGLEATNHFMIFQSCAGGGAAAGAALGSLESVTPLSWGRLSIGSAVGRRYRRLIALRQAEAVLGDGEDLVLGAPSVGEPDNSSVARHDLAPAALASFQGPLRWRRALRWRDRLGAKGRLA